MAITQFNLPEKQRAERKSLITVAEWNETNGEDIYTLQTSQPSDWTTNYTSYYTKDGNTYTAVPVGTGAPTWEASTYYTKTTTMGITREILGTRTPDSSLEFNLDMETSTDIRGINYTDANKTQPQQDFDPFLVLGGSKLGAKLHDIYRRNALSELSQFNVYIIHSYLGTSGAYEAERHSNCTITMNSMGGESNVNTPISVYLSNDWNGSGKPGTGTVDKLSDDFAFTADI